LGRLFQHSFAVAKQVRTDTAIGASPVSIAFAAVNLAKQIFSNLAELTALLIGAGETIELAARHLHEHRLRRMVIANRTVAKAHELAREFGAYAIELGELPAHLADADIVLSSTASPLPILGKGSVESALRTRKHRPMLMVDIAVPRDIEEEVGQLDDVYLYTVDDLQTVIRENLETRREAAAEAEEIIDVQAAHFMAWLASLDAVDAVRAYRSRVEQMRALELRKALRRLARGEDAAQTLSRMAHALSNKLMHEPSVRMRQASAQGRAEFLAMAKELLGIHGEEIE
jgi:glutamyl-tRNA reductase